MNNERMPSQAEEQKSQVETEPTPNSKEGYEGQKESVYAEALGSIQELIEAIPEAEEILYRERPASSPEQEVIGKYEMLEEALADLKERFAQQGEYHKERAVGMYLQKVEAEKTIAALYLDALAVNKEFAAAIAEDAPFLRDVLKGGVVNSMSEHLPQPEFVE